VRLGSGRGCGVELWRDAREFRGVNWSVLLSFYDVL